MTVLAGELYRQGVALGAVSEAREVVSHLRVGTQMTQATTARTAMRVGAALVIVGLAILIASHIIGFSERRGVFTMTWASIGFGAIHFIYGVRLERQLKESLSDSHGDFVW